MKPTHALAIAAVLAVAAVLGVVAATKTSQLGATAKHAAVSTIAARAHKLDSFEAALKKALLSKVPKLPKVPKVPAVHAVGRVGSAPVVGSASVVSASAPRVIYHRAAPIIIHTRTHHGDDGSEAAAGGVHAGSFASGGGLDD